MEPAGEDEVIRLQASLLDPRLQGIPGGRRDLELDRALGLVLQDDGARGNLVPMTNISDLQSDEIAPTQLAVDAQVEERELAHPVLHLETDTERPDVLELERGLLPDDLALVPRLAKSVDACVAHDGLSSS
jgi:hypothetical protein